MINTGKTTVARHFVASQPDPAAGFVIHSCSWYDPRYAEFLPADRLLEGDIDQTQIKATLRRIREIKPAYVVVDDCSWIDGFHWWIAAVDDWCRGNGAPLLVTYTWASQQQHRTDGVIVFGTRFEGNVSRIVNRFLPEVEGVAATVKSLPLGVALAVDRRTGARWRIDCRNKNLRCINDAESAEAPESPSEEV